MFLTYIFIQLHVCIFPVLTFLAELWIPVLSLLHTWVQPHLVLSTLCQHTTSICCYTDLHCLPPLRLLQLPLQLGQLLQGDNQGAELCCSLAISHQVIHVYLRKSFMRTVPILVIILT